MTRTGDIDDQPAAAAPFSRNILGPIGLILLAWAWMSWFGRRLGDHRVPDLHPPVPVSYGSIVVLVLFAALRNLPMTPFSGLAL